MHAAASGCVACAERRASSGRADEPRSTWRLSRWPATARASSRPIVRRPGHAAGAGGRPRGRLGIGPDRRPATGAAARLRPGAGPGARRPPAEEDAAAGGRRRAAGAVAPPPARRRTSPRRTRCATNLRLWASRCATRRTARKRRSAAERVVARSVSSHPGAGTEGRHRLPGGLRFDRYGDPPVADREHDSVCSIGCVELVRDRPQVIADRLIADAELLADLPVRPAAGDIREDLELTVGHGA